ncbi:hypothetical protein MCOR02_006593 [Pyricularia oryzae]|uniref:Uncharacterized protein n=1 Tax=Pyricularia grisea TaxID=148305 RepID=A0ABQ8NMH4_PYRGI|nr:hypothetical protein MCOR02_006593 [Pyricularia oryzae]KAI6298789.1 hypothetical protein MCOR33_005174 [Pyricularia grisea]KAI6397796.1 hypothetical protein MCOR23_005991 [Pyricularia oryzae]KAI6441912.1 hypothetical protein MCOR17_011668 [Pyricularia oryzae]KAI6479578.1 hypothetical protein MCOR13_011421 [Pyricularia oryzae]
MMETRRLMVGIGPRQREPTEWDMCNCNPIGVRGGGHHALRKLHAEFNRWFGDARLHIASLQAYVTSCHGHFFAVTYMGSGSRWEVSNIRNIVKDANPGTGGSCRLVVFRGSMIRYMFGVGDGGFEWRVDRRDC